MSLSPPGYGPQVLVIVSTRFFCLVYESLFFSPPGYGPQVLVIVSMYQGAILGTFFLTHSHIPQPLTRFFCLVRSSPIFGGLVEGYESLFFFTTRIWTTGFSHCFHVPGGPFWVPFF